MEMLERNELKKNIKFNENKKGYCDEPIDPLNFNLHKLMKDKANLENFKEFLRQNYALLDLECWIDIEAYM